ncbi:MAG TPA: hypothetical protein VE128_00410 [Candidatus Angelobacter sp.]|nr:hypothetical protein [Candidatus Angelobacter sp.]
MKSLYDSKVDDYLYNDIMLEKLVEKTFFTKDFIHIIRNIWITRIKK